MKRTAQGMPRVGVYVCHCGTNIAATVNVEAVTQFAASLPGVVVARHYPYMCSDPGQGLIKDDIQKKNLKRVVVASCSPLMHEATFRGACADAGLNPFLFQMTNIREHCSWVTDDSSVATEKAKALVAAAVQRVQWQVPLEARQVGVKQSALVVGGGIAGIEAALRLADAGKHVYLVEREPSIGGHMARLYKTFPTMDCASCILTPKMVAVGRHENITLLTYSEVEKVSGYVGNFTVTVRRKPRYIDEELCNGCGTCMEKCPWKKIPSEFDAELGYRPAIYYPFPQAVPRIPVIDTENCVYFKTGKCRACEKFCLRQAVDFDQQERFLEIEVGAIVLATGFHDFDPRRAPQYGYGVLDNVLTGLELERLVNTGGPTLGKVVLKDGRKPEKIAILHCVGSRGDEVIEGRSHEYCSRVCCMYSLKLAQLVRDYVGAEVVEFYRDMRAFGKGYEAFYERVHRDGATFMRFSDKLRVEQQDGHLCVIADDVYTGGEQVVPVDMAVLSTGMEAQPDAQHVAQIFGINLSLDGFFLERHPKLAPVDTATDGIFVTGTCQGPKDIPDSVAQGGAAAAEALALMDAGQVNLDPFTSHIDAEKCGGCRTCEGLCPYNAIEMVQEGGRLVASVNEVLCKGCGACAAACPAGAAMQNGFTNDQVLAEIEGILMSLVPTLLPVANGQGVSEVVT